MDVRALYDDVTAAIGARDLTRIRELSDSDRFVESVRILLDTFSDLEFEPEWVLAEGRMAAGWATVRGVHSGEWLGIAPTGRRVEYRGVMAVEVNDDGRVADFWVVSDFLSLALQLGAELRLPPS